LSREPNPPARLFNGRQLLGTARGGFVETLVACDVSLNKASDFRNHPAVRSRVSFPRDRGLAGVVNLQILDYPAQGDPQTLAKEALLGVSWADQGSVAIDRERNEVVIGVRVMAVNTGPAKQALERRGFRIGGVSLQPTR